MEYRAATQRFERFIKKTFKNKDKMLQHEDLYAGLPKEKAEAYRAEAIERWGQDTVEKSENAFY